jgi:hypothetical protein
MSAINPYQTPTDAQPPSLVRSSIDATAKEVFLAWEKLRLSYNIVLLMLTVGGLGLLGTGPAKPLELLGNLIGGAVIANVCFCAGPCAEGYLTWIGANRRITRMILFAVGLAVASLLALAEVFRNNYPPH